MYSYPLVNTLSKGIKSLRKNIPQTEILFYLSLKRYAYKTRHGSSQPQLLSAIGKMPTARQIAWFLFIPQIFCKNQNICETLITTARGERAICNSFSVTFPLPCTAIPFPLAIGLLYSRPSHSATKNAILINPLWLVEIKNVHLPKWQWSDLQGSGAGFSCGATASRNKS